MEEVSTNVKNSEKGPSHDISNNIKHWQDLPAPRKILRGRGGGKEGNIAKSYNFLLHVLYWITILRMCFEQPDRVR